ncbi:MAG TPA: hypothetical protein VJS37_10685 [Terriglobales bacterium]|nr:hypothetical protein [Terriglobales bacterium]
MPGTLRYSFRDRTGSKRRVEGGRGVMDYGSLPPRMQPGLADRASQFDVFEALQTMVVILAAVLAIGSTVLSPALRRRNS